MAWVFAIAMAWGIGANDVANCFSTSVGSKALTLRQATIAASFFEVFGAIFLSKSVTDTVRKSIVSFDDFIYNPDIMMYVMFSALIGASTWLVACSFSGHPVSTTHSIIGGIIGAGCSVNYDLVAWDSVTDVILSWIYSPVLSAFLGAGGYYLFRAGIMRQENAPEIIIKAFPVLLFLCYGALFNMIMFKNSELFGWDLSGEREGNEGAFAGITTAISAVAAGLTFLPLYPKLKALAAQADEPATNDPAWVDAASTSADGVVPAAALESELELARLPTGRVDDGPLKNNFLRDHFREPSEMRE